MMFLSGGTVFVSWVRKDDWNGKQSVAETSQETYCLVQETEQRELLSA